MQPNAAFVSAVHDKNAKQLLVMDFLEKIHFKERKGRLVSRQLKFFCMF
jgi:hypothetical protein